MTPLRQERKEQVSNYDVLVAAEKKLAQLQDEAVANVEALINANGQPVTPASRAAVEAAQAHARPGPEAPGPGGQL